MQVLPIGAWGLQNLPLYVEHFTVVKFDGQKFFLIGNQETFDVAVDLQVKIGPIRRTILSLVVGRSTLFVPLQDHRDHTLLCFKERFSENLCGR